MLKPPSVLRTAPVRAPRNPAAVTEQSQLHCFLCGRPLGRRVEWHHPVPKSRGGRLTEPVHPICHRAIHRAIDNKGLERHFSTAAALRAHPELARFIAWVADKKADFHAPTRRPRR